MKRFFGFFQIIVGIASIVFMLYSINKYDLSDLFPMIFSWGALFVVLIILGFKQIKEDNQDMIKDNYYISVKTKFKETREFSGSENVPGYCYVITSWVNPNDHKLYLFRSKNVGYGNGKIIEEMGISEFVVNYNSRNIKDYEMDVESLRERLRNE